MDYKFTVLTEGDVIRTLKSIFCIKTGIVLALDFVTSTTSLPRLCSAVWLDARRLL